ncbi:MAG: RNA polymerase sigma factor [Sphingobacteriaceae bacterium]
MSKDLVDNELILKLHQNDISAFDSLYWKYHQPVLRNIIKLTRDSEVAQDILQDVFSTLWEKRHDINTQNSISGWLFVVSYNQSISYLRKVLRESTAKKTLEITPIATEALDNLNISENRYELLQLAIEKLSPQKRKVFILCKVEGKSYEEAARELNISKHTVKEYLSLSMISIKAFVNKHPESWKTAILFFLFVDKI